MICKMFAALAKKDHRIPLDATNGDEHAIVVAIVTLDRCSVK